MTAAGSKPAPGAAKDTGSAAGGGSGSSASADAELEAAGKIKGNRDSMLYHTVESPYYKRTKAEEWFDTEAEAKAAGFNHWKQRS